MEEGERKKLRNRGKHEIKLKQNDTKYKIKRNSEKTR